MHNIELHLFIGQGIPILSLLVTHAKQQKAQFLTSLVCPDVDQIQIRQQLGMLTFMVMPQVTKLSYLLGYYR